MNGFRRFMSGITAGLVLSGVMGGAALPAFAASAVYVDDTNANNDSISCPATTNTTIQDGIDAAQVSGAKTVIVCEGAYTAGGFVSNFTGGLTVKAFGTVIVAPIGPYGDDLFQATDSKNVNFQGFVIDGLSSNLQGSDAFYFYNASGSITGNTVKHWRDATPWAAAGINRGVYIHSDTKLSVKVDKNSFTNMSNYGAWVESPGGVTISNNFFQAYTIWNNAGTPANVNYNITGIYLSNTAGAKVLSNTIWADQNLLLTGISISRGIFLSNASSNQVSSNTINNYYHGIQLVTGCPGASSSNTINGNRLLDTKVGISAGNWGGCATDLYQGNKITSNKVYTWGGIFDTGIRVAAFGAEVVTGNLVKGNTIGGYATTPLDVSGGNTVSGNKTYVYAPPPPGS